jgi:hypothetical protein
VRERRIRRKDVRANAGGRLKGKNGQQRVSDRTTPQGVSSKVKDRLGTISAEVATVPWISRPPKLENSGDEPEYCF